MLLTLALLIANASKVVYYSITIFLLLPNIPQVEMNSVMDNTLKYLVVVFSFVRIY